MLGHNLKYPEFLCVHKQKESMCEKKIARKHEERERGGKEIRRERNEEEEEKI